MDAVDRKTVLRHAPTSIVVPGRRTERSTHPDRVTVRELRTMTLASRERPSRSVARSQRLSTRSVHRSTMASHALAPAMATRPMIVQRQDRSVVVAAPASGHLVRPTPAFSGPAATAAAAQASLHATRSATHELVWGAPESHAANSAREPAQPVAHAVATQPTAPPNRTHADIAVAVAAQVRKATESFAMPQGPALDRLADEVMRRVEKGLRIERERRGR
jgi:hypothetical protein